MPGDGTGLALVSSEFDAPPDLFGDPSRPTGLVDRAIDRFDLIPSLSGHDLGQVRRVECLLGSRRGCRQIGVGRQWGGSTAFALARDQEGWVRERDVDPVCPNRPIQI